MTKTLRLRAEGIGGEATVRRAAELIRGGGTVAFPTETVYGLGANALDADAVGKIFSAKDRPHWDPLIVHVEGPEMFARVAAVAPGAAEERASLLMKTFWPGPLTLLLPRASGVPDAVTAGRELVGVRAPAHPVARELIRLAGVPIAAPSANRFGHTSPTTADHVLADLDGRIDAVLDGGGARVGVESTVFDVEAMRIYRPGAVTAEGLSEVLGGRVAVETGAQEQGSAARASPGTGMRHYAPRARLVLVATQRELLAAVRAQNPAETGVMLPDEWGPGDAAMVFRWGPWDRPEILARLLFFGLRFLDDRGAGVIVCPMPGGSGMAEAIRDRLTKASRAE